MARGRLLNSIEDFIIEWAAAHSTRSVRDFLMSEKGLTERQYRYVISKVPFDQWKIRRGEIQNAISATKIDRLVEKAVDVHWDFIRSAQVGSAKIRQKLQHLGDEPDSNQLLDCLRALESAQNVFLRAMGVPKGEGMLQQYHRCSEATAARTAPGPTALTKQMPDLTYDDVMTLIEIKRESKMKAFAETTTV